MTTAHRATWRSALGGDQEQGSFRLHVGTAQKSSKAAPSHRVLKKRDDDVVTDRGALRAALEADEATTLRAFKGAHDEAIRRLDDDVELATDDEEDNESEAPRKRSRIEKVVADSDDSDDEAELLAELEKIRAERAAERARLEAERAEEANAATATDNPLLGNLLDDDTASVATATTNASVAVKRRWNDDVLFKNQARGSRKPEQRFVNDTVRNDFHRRFLRRYIL